MSNVNSVIVNAVKIIKERTLNFIPKVGIILGSGLGPLADQIVNPIQISYEDLSGFPVSTVKGHTGSYIFGMLGGIPVACLKGRVHMYEGEHAFDGIKLLIRTLRQLGCHTLLSTNAVGSLRREIGPGEVVLITDHINFVQFNPLIGENEDASGPRFFPMDDAYDVELGKKLHAVANELGIALHDGIYIATTGPCFETPAEIRAFRTLGADLVGMSTVPDVIVAKHCGLKVVAISAVTNLASGMGDEQLSHEGTLKYAKLSEEKLCNLVRTFLERHANEFSQ